MTFHPKNESRRFKPSVLAAAIALVMVPALPAVAQQSGDQASVSSQAEQTFSFDIPAQPLAQAITEFSAVTGIQVLYTGEDAFNFTASALQGNYTATQALDRLLMGSGLGFRFTGANSVTLTGTDSAVDDAPAVLQPLQVTGARVAVSTANAGETTTATRFPVESRSVPSSIGVVGEEVIEQTNSVRDLGDISNYVSGVSREPDLARSGNFFMRGFPVGVRATVDGLRNPRGTESARSFTVTDLALYDQVEFLKGSSAILFGQGEPGGNVNFISKKPEFERARSLEAGVSSDDYYRGVFDTTGPINDDVAYRVIAVAQNKNTPFTQPSHDDRLIFNPSILWQTPGGGSVYFDYEYNDAEVTGFDANAILINGEVTEFATSDPVYDNTDKLETHNLRLHVEQPITAEWSLALDTAYSTQDNDTNQTSFWSVDDPFNSTSASGFAFFQDRTDSAIVVRPELRGEFNLGNTRHRLAIGYMYNDYEGDFSRTLSGSYGSGNDPFNPNYGAPLPAPLATPVEFTLENQEQNIYVFDHLDIGQDWHVMGGLTYVQFEGYRDADGSREKNLDNEDVVPSLGAVYDLSKQASVYASWSRSFERSGGQDVNGNFFDPSEGEQFEVGVKGDAYNERLFYTLALFDLTQSNITTTDPENPQFSAPLGEVNVRGVELDLSASLTQRLDAIMALTYHDSEITKNNDGREGEELANTPNFSGTWRLSYQATNDFRVGGSLIYVGEREGADFGPTFEVDDYTRVDLDMDWRVPEVRGLTISAQVENLFGEDYVAGSTSASRILIGRPQTFWLSGKYDF